MRRRLTLILLGATVGGTLYLARRRARETGRTLLEVLPEVPADAQRLLDEGVERIKAAIETGCQAAAAKQAEIESVVESGAR